MLENPFFFFRLIKYQKHPAIFPLCYKYIIIQMFQDFTAAFLDLPSLLNENMSQCEALAARPI